ncbi:MULTISPECIES: hypothetical protein [Acinetobacter]|uniref:Restriction endonuclease n=1 Tax=Acinetobacter colistiniresistens TaxID=280145 RepID=A0A558ERE9_9GAMM|nr:hypothetical protein [Acinetobacter colistiniresistens]TVT75822.1 hypothetical protein FPV60_21350 [Acinetobacter colistiniresistens]
MSIPSKIAYEKAFEVKCFRLMNEAYEESLALKTIQLDWDENDISQELCERIDLNHLRRKWRIFVSREHHLTSTNVNKIKGFANSLSRIDFKMATFNKSDEHLYYFEAKRIKEKDSSLKRSYINEGMDRFIKNKYPLGCMLGFLLEGDLHNTVGGINKLLISDKRNLEVLNLSTATFKNYYESRHVTIDLLKHLILDFTVTK